MIFGFYLLFSGQVISGHAVKVHFSERFEAWSGRFVSDRVTRVVLGTGGQE